MVAGFISKGKEPGFCALTKDILGGKTDINLG